LLGQYSSSGVFVVNRLTLQQATRIPLVSGQDCFGFYFSEVSRVMVFPIFAGGGWMGPKSLSVSAGLILPGTEGGMPGVLIWATSCSCFCFGGVLGPPRVSLIPPQTVTIKEGPLPRFFLDCVTPRSLNGVSFLFCLSNSLHIPGTEFFFFLD